MNKKITLKEFFKMDRAAIHCDTEEKANRLLMAFDKMGKTWFTRDTYLFKNNWEYETTETCYTNTGTHSPIKRLIYLHYTIYEFEEVDLTVEEPQITVEEKMKAKCSSGVKPAPIIDKHQSICDFLHETYISKNHDYGDSFGKTFKELGIISAVTRISDKNNRLITLATKGNQKVNDESIKDTLLDMANYCIMTVMELDKE